MVDGAKAVISFCIRSAIPGYIVVPPDKTLLAKRFRSPEAFITNGDDLTDGKLVRLVNCGRGSCSVHFAFKIEGNVAKLFLDITDDFSLSSGGEGVTTFSHDLHEVGSQIATSQVQTEDGVGKSVPFVDGDGVRYTITRIENDTGGTTRSIQGEDSLDSDVHCWGSECFKHDLSHLLTVSLGVKRSFSEEHWAFLRCYTKFVVERVMPDLLHIIPVGDDTVLNGVLQGEDTSLALGFISDVGVLLAHTDHDTLMTGATYDGGEYSSGSGISGETGFDHTGAIVDHQRSIVFVTHLDGEASTGFLS